MNFKLSTLNGVVSSLSFLVACFAASYTGISERELGLRGGQTPCDAVDLEPSKCIGAPASSCDGDNHRVDRCTTEEDFMPGQWINSLCADNSMYNCTYQHQDCFDKPGQKLSAQSCEPWEVEGGPID